MESAPGCFSPVQNSFRVDSTRITIPPPDTTQTAIKAYPNPTSKDLIIEYQLEKKASIAIEIASNNGIILHRYEYGQEEKAQYRKYFNIQELKLRPGLYYFILTLDNTEQRTKKVLVQ
jgi:hypothetical protein